MSELKYGCVACDWTGEQEDTFVVEDTDQELVIFAACPRCWAECQPLFPVPTISHGEDCASLL